LRVLVLFLLVLLIWVVLMGFLFIWTFWFQGYIYTEPATQLYWRAPAAGSALTLFLILWITVDYRSVKNNPDTHFPYGPLQELDPGKTDTTPFPSLFIPGEGTGAADVEYKLTKVAEGKKVHDEYRHEQTPIPSRPRKVIVVGENGEKIEFKPDMDAKGQFKTDRGQPLFYRDEKGHALREGTFEREGSYRLGPFFFGVMLNVTFLVVWFVCLWLLLRYQLWHAIGLAIVLYVVMLLFIVAPVMSRAETAARPPVHVPATNE
jgi:hypothetical protein